MHKEWAESFLNSYQETRPLVDEEKKYLTAAARFGMIAYIRDYEHENKVSSVMFERYQLLAENVTHLLTK